MRPITGMQLIAGLGNPGAAYARTPHNIGFRCLDRLAADHGLSFGPVRDGCQVAEGRIAGVETILVKPLRYMNLSGEALATWAVRQGILLTSDVEESVDEPVPPLAVVDDIALPLGSLRLRARGSDGGHRGLESLDRVLGGGVYPRLRLGVGPTDAEVPPERWADYVLEDFGDEAWAISNDLAAYGAEVVAAFVKHGVEWTASRFNRRGTGADEGDLRPGA